MDSKNLTNGITVPWFEEPQIYSFALGLTFLLPKEMYSVNALTSIIALLPKATPAFQLTVKLYLQYAWHYRQ